MKENSIEEVLKKLSTGKKIKMYELLRTFKKEGIENFVITRKKYVDVILSDYKRVLKENELLRKDIEGWKKYCEEIEEEQTEMSNKNCQLEFEVEKLQKENEELKQDRNNNYKLIALAQNEALGYMQGYEDGKKLKKSVLAYIEENQQYYIIKKKIEHYEEYIVKLQKENEELKNQEATARKINELLVRRYSNLIPVQKVKDKIEELKQEKKKYGNCLIEMYEDELVNRDIKILQELLEGRK